MEALSNNIDFGAVFGGALAAKGRSRPKDVEKAAKDFEAVFLGQMIELMMKEVGKNPFSGESAFSAGEDIYHGMFAQELGKKVAAAGGIGVADHVKRQMLKYQEIGKGVTS